MVVRKRETQRLGFMLSVLALSSRFDGQGDIACIVFHRYPFSTRSVESF